MSKWTKEEVLREAAGIESHGYVAAPAMLREYAAHLAQPEWPSDEDVAQMFHEEYERLAPLFGYETREETKSFDHRSINGRLMTAVCKNLRAYLQSVRLPVGVVSNEDVEMVCAKIFNGWPDVFAPNNIRMDVRAALESYAYRHAPTKD